MSDEPRLSPNGRYLAFHRGGNTSTVYQENFWIRDLKTGSETLISHTGDFIVNYSWSPDSRYIASASTDTTVQVWLVP